MLHKPVQFKVWSLGHHDWAFVRNANAWAHPTPLNRIMGLGPSTLCFNKVS